MEQLQNHDKICIFEHSIPILGMSKNGVLINKKAKSLEKLDMIDWTKDKQITNKLRASSYGQWELNIGITNMNNFDKREQLDNLFISKKSQDLYTAIERISIQKALEKIFQIRFECDMDYYLKNQDQIRHDLGRDIYDAEFKDDYSFRVIEEELFYRQMIDLFGVMADDDNVKAFGDETTYEKSFNLKDFHVLFTDDNFIYASARRGNYYILLYFMFYITFPY
jgi:hypothetical protein